MLNSFTHAGAQHFCQIARARQFDLKNRYGLIVGCGQGHEAVFLGRHLQTRIVGIDMHLSVTDVQCEGFNPVTADALRLPFQEGVFDFVFYHHVIEHVPDPHASLIEIKRVLRSKGWLYIGTPNRHRLVGYLGSYTATFRQKVRWNFTDYAARLRGKFRNEAGAHAGFSQQELGTMLQGHFSEIEWLTRDYLWLKYAACLPRSILEILTWKHVIEFAAPSIYVLCRK